MREIKRSLIALSSISALFFQLFLFPSAASACPDEMPATLLSLYKNSDVIVTARFLNQVDGPVTEEEEESYSLVRIFKYFSVVSDLKGDGPTVFVAEDEEYRPKSPANAVEADAAEAEEHGNYDENSELKEDDTAILFLSDEGDGKFVLSNIAYGIKKLSPEHLKIYEASIRDLNSIYTAEKASDEKVLDWIIRM
ncbi:MAG: hypothetical protein WBD22_03260, partial [Pyrinomonadaceae bacterium]